MLPPLHDSLSPSATGRALQKLSFDSYSHEGAPALTRVPLSALRATRDKTLALTGDESPYPTASVWGALQKSSVWVGQEVDVRCVMVGLPRLVALDDRAGRREESPCLFEALVKTSNYAIVSRFSNTSPRLGRPPTVYVLALLATVWCACVSFCIVCSDVMRAAVAFKWKTFAKGAWLWQASKEV